jgi:photosystem II stability/assembly factor-like uncharacterized protein
VGEGGVIVSTADRGATWRSRASGTSNGLKAVTCSTSRACVVVGYGNGAGESTILTSADGGATWQPRSSGTQAGLLRVSCPTSHFCLAVGVGGTMLTSEDGGTTWHNRTIGGVSALRGIACLPAGRGSTRPAGAQPGSSPSSTCLAVGDAGTILQSTDGGVSWQRRPSDTSDDLKAVTCPTSTTCLAVGGRTQYPDQSVSSTIVASVDGGATWHRRARATSNALLGVVCPAARACIAVGDAGTILASADGGVTWHSRASGTTYDLDGVACPALWCLAVGGNLGMPGAGTIVGSPDDGASWQTLLAGSNNGPYSDLYAVACPRADLCVAVGQYTDGLALGEGDMLLGTPGGSAWSYPYRVSDHTALPTSTTDLYGITCPSSKACLAVGDGDNLSEPGDGGTIVSSGDGGATWQNRPSGTGNQLYAVTCPSSRACLAVGANGTILESTDGATG